MYQVFFAGVPLAFALLHFLLYVFYPQARDHLLYAIFTGSCAAATFFLFQNRFITSTPLYLADSLAQIMGLGGLIQTARRTAGWAIRLMRGDIVRTSDVPRSTIPMRSAEGAAASHALPGTPSSSLVQVSVQGPASAEADWSQSTQRKQGTSES